MVVFVFVFDKDKEGKNPLNNRALLYLVSLMMKDHGSAKG